MNNTKKITFFLLLCSGFMSCIYWNPTLGGKIIKILMYICLIYIFCKKKQISFFSSGISVCVLCFAFIPFLSIITAYLVHEQSFLHSCYGSQMHLMYLFYFLFHSYKINTKNILTSFFLLGVLWCLIEIIQQISYPSFWFATRMDNDEMELEIRNGIYRYNVFGYQFGLIMLFYSFTQYLKNRKIVYLFGLILGLVGIYLLATRQIMFAAILCLLYALYSREKIKMSSLLIVIGCGFLIYKNFNQLFGEFVDMTKEIDEDYVRFLSYEFYGVEYNNGNLLQILLGNGDPVRDSKYQLEINSYEEEGLWRSDIGLVGLYSLYGFFYIITIIYFFIFCYRNRKYIDLYLKMYLVFMFSTSIMLLHFGYGYGRIAITSFIFYLVDKSITYKKTKLKVYAPTSNNCNTCL